MEDGCSIVKREKGQNEVGWKEQGGLAQMVKRDRWLALWPNEQTLFTCSLDGKKDGGCKVLLEIIKSNYKIAKDPKDNVCYPTPRLRAG